MSRTRPSRPSSIERRPYYDKSYTVTGSSTPRTQMRNDTSARAADVVIAVGGRPIDGDKEWWAIRDSNPEPTD